MVSLETRKALTQNTEENFHCGTTDFPTVKVARKNQYCEHVYTTQSNLQIQCNPYQITSGIFYRTRTKSLKIYMEIQKTLNSQSNLEGKKTELEESGSLTSDNTTKLQ